jgi:hypothetical protein
MYNNTTLNPWGSKDDEGLAREVFREAFGPGTECPSLYGVVSLMDEIRTAAAFALTTTDKELKNFFVVRIFPPDLHELDLWADDEAPGTTGVVEVDFLHFEVRNMTPAKASALTARLRNTAAEGAERFRWVAGRFQRLHLERFLQAADEQVIAEAKRRCRFRLGLGGSPEQRGTIARILAELERNKPAVPRFRVERAAFLNYCERARTCIPGSPDTDWAKGERDLLEAYQNAFR